MKRLASFLILLLATASLFAIPPIDEAFPITQSDGSVIMVKLFGEWRTEFYVTQDQQVLVRGKNRDLCYARLENGQLVSTDVVAHEADSRAEAERTFVRQNTLTPLQAAATVPAMHPAKAHAPNRIIRASTSDGLGAYGQRSLGAVPSLGDVVIPVIMAEFTDMKFQSTTTIEKMTRVYNEEGYKEDDGCVGSARDYFIAQSGGMFRPKFVVVAKVSLAHNYAYYGSNDKSRGYVEVVSDAMVAAQRAGVKWTDYVQDGNVPLVAVLYAGEGEATGGGDDTLWPCEYDVNTNWCGVHVNSLFIGNELAHDKTIAGIGTFCHEFGHALGLPDFYVTNYGHEQVTMGRWDIMCSGSYLPDSRARAPMGYTAYERSYMGWLNIPELTEADNVTLFPFEEPDKGPCAALIRNSRNPGEYFILEHRAPGTWYPRSYGSGLFVTHVTYDANAWYYNNLNNTEGALRMTYLSATGQKSGGNASELFPGTNGNRTSLTTSTTPSLTLYNGSKLNKPIYNITRESDGTVSFSFLDPDFVGRSIGDLVEADGIAYRFISKAQVEVKENDTPYSGEISVPSYYSDGTHHYTVAGIGSGAFANCTSLTTVSIPASVRTIAPDAFRHTTSLRGITVSEDNETFLSQDGILYTNSMMIYDPETAVQAVILDNVFDFAANPWVLDVATNALKYDKGLVDTELREGIVTMTPKSQDDNGRTLIYMMQSGDNVDLRARTGAAMTFSVDKGSVITRIEFTASAFAVTASTGTLDGTTWTGNAESVTFTFTGNSRITKASATTVSRRDLDEATLIHYPAARTGSFVVPFGVVHISDYAFEDTHLSELILSDSLRTLGTLSLSSANLSKLTARSLKPATAESDPFGSINRSACTLVVPQGTEDAYRTAAWWSSFFDPDGILRPTLTNDDDNALYDLSGRRVRTPQHGVYILGGRKVLR